MCKIQHPAYPRAKGCFCSNTKLWQGRVNFIDFCHEPVLVFSECANLYLILKAALILKCNVGFYGNALLTITMNDALSLFYENKGQKINYTVGC